MQGAVLSKSKMSLSLEQKGPLSLKSYIIRFTISIATNDDKLSIPAAISTFLEGNKHAPLQIGPINSKKAICRSVLIQISGPVNSKKAICRSGALGLTQTYRVIIYMIHISLL